MALVRQYPDIVNPFKLAPGVQKDRSFVRDLSLDALLESVPFYSNDTRELARKVLVELGADLPTIEYRQDILQDLISSGSLLQTVLKCMSSLNELGYLLGGFNDEANLTNGLRLARAYRDFIMTPPDFGGVKSRGLKEIEAYLAEIKASEEFSGLCRFVETVGNLGGVVFRVSLDSQGLPATMSAIELVEREPNGRTGILAFFGRLLGKKRFETSLKGAGGLNEAGRVLRGFIDAQFVPIVKGYLDQIRQVISLLESLGFYVGFAEYFVKMRDQKIDVCRPILFPKDRRVMMARNARNPLLLKEGRDGRHIVPNDIAYMPEQNMFVITGPNNGGKTTYVTTVGLVQLMGQKGLFVPAESAEISLVDGVYTHFVTPDDITKGEGRYRNELMRVKEIFEAATPYSLVILDEPCGGTSYEEGCRQSLVLLEGLHKLGPATYFTTHMHPVAKEVDIGRYPAAKNLSVECLYDGRKIKYTYKVKPGASGKSYGEEIARDIGLMPEKIEELVSKRAEEQGYTEIIRK